MFKDAVQYSPCVNNIEFYSKTIYIFMILEYDKLSRHYNQALQVSRPSKWADVYSYAPDRPWNMNMMGASSIVSNILYSYFNIKRSKLIWTESSKLWKRLSSQRLMHMKKLPKQLHGARPVAENGYSTASCYQLLG
jgi:hypothetical protein